MNESLFAQAAFDRAQPLNRPDFGVLLTLASLRQVNSPTARSAMALRRPERVPSARAAMALLAGETRGLAQLHGFAASFHDLDERDADPVSRVERAINLGISTYVQTPPVNSTAHQDIRECLKTYD